jgi:nicotinamidase-related amidase
MKKCLIVVDYQNDFVGGALGFAGADSIEDAIIKKIHDYHTRNDDVIFTKDTHDASYLDKEEGKNLPVEHCIKGTKGHDLRASVEAVKQDTDKVFEKPTFPSLELGNYLKDKPYDTIELCGLVSHICVLSNAVIAKAACPNAHIIVDKNATKSYDKTLHQKALDVMAGIHIDIIE